MNKKEKIVNKKILGLILLIILLLGTTYAWFTQNKNVQVTGLDVTVQTVGNLEISADGNEWGYSIEKSELEGKNEEQGEPVNYLPEELFPVSTEGGHNAGKLKMFKGTVNRAEDDTYTISTSEISGDGYMAFDLFFRTEVAQTLCFSESTTVTVEDTDYGADNAARIAIMDIANSSSGANEIKGSVYSNRGIHIFEPNSEERVAATEAFGQNKINYAGVNKAATDQEICYTKEENEEWPAYLTEMNTDELKGKTDIMELEPGVTKVRIVLWLEGQDVECIDYVGGDKLKFNLKFTSEENN